MYVPVHTAVPGTVDLGVDFEKSKKRKSKIVFFRKTKDEMTTIYNKHVIKRCQCLFLNIYIISVLYSNNGDFGLHVCYVYNI